MSQAAPVRLSGWFITQDHADLAIAYNELGGILCTFLGMLHPALLQNIVKQAL
jgi:hypothetical protein